MRRPSFYPEAPPGARASRPHRTPARCRRPQVYAAWKAALPGGTLLASLLAFSVLASPAEAKHFKAPLIPVESRGSMKEIYQDDAAAKIKLSELQGVEHLYALGPLSKLRGEIIIWDSVPQESRANRGHIQVKSDWEESAAFLVWSKVSKWKKIEVPTSVRSMQTLEMWLNSMSNMEAAPLRREYPFLLKGHFGRIAWHVVNSKEDGKPLTPSKHQEQKFHGQTTDVKAEMLGFFAPEKQGEFIPRGQKTHLHVRVGEQLVAHVEDFDPVGDYSIKLYVPSP